MDYPERAPVLLLQPPAMVVGDWYLKGFADAYGAHWAVIPSGPAGEHYKKGYALGLATVRAEFLAATWGPFRFSMQPAGV